MPCAREEAARVRLTYLVATRILRSCLQAERGGDIVEIGHGAHVDPGLRHRHDDIGVAEAERLEQHDARVGVGDHLAHQVFAGDAEMHGALRQQLPVISEAER